MKLALLLIGSLWLGGAAGSAQTSNLKTAATAGTAAAVDSQTNVRAEQLRAQGIQGRRCICGRVLQILTNGVVVESGYTDLLRSGLKGDWHFPSTVTATRDSRLVEDQVPGSICVGKLFLTDLPRKRGVKIKLHLYDYVVVEAYPAGKYTYTSIEGLPHTVRRFACGLETAVNLQLKSEDHSK